MQIILFQIVTLLTVIVLPMFLFGRKIRRRKPKAVVYKIDTDTSEAHYAINEQGFLEEIKIGKLSNNKY